MMPIFITLGEAGADMVQMRRTSFVFLDSPLIRAVLACTGRLGDGKRSSLQSLLVLHLQEHKANH